MSLAANKVVIVVRCTDSIFVWRSLGENLYGNFSWICYLQKLEIKLQKKLCCLKQFLCVPFDGYSKAIWALGYTNSVDCTLFVKIDNGDATFILYVDDIIITSDCL